MFEMIKCGCCKFESFKNIKISPSKLKCIQIKTDHWDDDCWTEIPVSVKEEEYGKVMGILYLLRCPKCGTIKIQ